MEKLRLRDFLSYQFLSGLIFSPDGRHAAFVAATAKADESGYDRNLWLFNVETGALRQLTFGGDASACEWLDARTLLFSAMRDAKLSERTEKGEALTSYLTLDIDGGEARPFCTVPAKVSRVRALDSNRFVLLCEFRMDGPDLSALEGEAKNSALEALRKEKDYEVLEEIPFWRNGVGFTNRKRKRLYLYTRSTGELSPISQPDADVGSFGLWDGCVLYVSCAFEGKMDRTNGLFLYNPAVNSTRTLVEQGQFNIREAGMLDGEIVFFASRMQTYGLNESPALYALRDGKPALLWAKDEAPGSNVGSDCRLGGGQSILFAGGWVYYTVARHTGTALVRVNAAGREEVLLPPEGSVDCFDLAGETLLFVGMRGMRLQELYALQAGEVRRLSALNERIVAEKTLSKPEPLFVPSDDVTIEGFVIKPVDFDPARRYPCILDIHGGPKTAYGSVFFHEMQLWANEGYFVVLCNPRGSEGRGDRFADIRGCYGTIDYDDLMRFLDGAIAAYPQIDPQRLGVTGGSYGGFMTNWIIGHTDRFRAAASQRSIANWISKFCTTDIGYYFNADQIQATPWHDPEKLWWHSPLRYADKAVTPTLFIHSDEDYRCWMAEGLQMFTALKYHGIPARLCLFRGENHELSRGGKPCHRVRRLEEITNWFAAYLR